MYDTLFNHCVTFIPMSIFPTVDCFWFYYCFVFKTEIMHRGRHTRKAVCWFWQRLKKHSCKPGSVNAKDGQQAPEVTREAWNNFFPRDSRRSQPWQYLDMDFQYSNCEMINFCCFKPHSLWKFVMAALGNEYSGPLHLH